MSVGILGDEGTAVTPDLAEVLAVGNDTGGLGIFSDAAGSAAAVATSVATSIDGAANASAEAAASGDGNADVSRVAGTSGTGEADCSSNAVANGGNATVLAAAETVGTGAATGGSTATAAAGIARTDSTATSVDSLASAVLTAVHGSGEGATQASFGVVADGTRPDLQCNGVTIFTSAAAPAPEFFASLIYVDTTPATGGTYMWDFVADAYAQIAPPLS